MKHNFMTPPYHKVKKTGVGSSALNTFTLVTNSAGSERDMQRVGRKKAQSDVSW